ncbi:MAG: Trehalose transport system permease protein SugA [Chroococcidiopsis cubana SAG 39.79]|uniref:Carbohydrate ABC transporter membrane protein 1, CUT1 family n=3 Tax=Chroococcidiopsis TaxID=54298 RepID=K9TY74_CHRTP|nr:MULTISPECIES: sugar ABC transporter permease [Chroococcidiopsis]AFY87328.1 carbohydrate ABC transporter membrane protein 1, CUT1 family [Chroococcidiopsis thermalis PCC 7203]MDZ4874690.1 Trehalose transport system permease protein SugA [Chroococcidiopsis cubana SAG 39.79]PSB62484.1 sugar ABC transporter permease [Chroococcidiopsis cubana CCALA 043]RUT08728.1 ABC transporter permease [Chroococcidiopsis cubana SAG 39.79]
MKLDVVQKREQKTGWILLLPALIVMLVVYAYPILRAFWLSVFTQNLGTELELVFSGLSNYGRMFNDGRFWQSLWNTTVFTTASVLSELILGIGVALVLNQAFKGRGIVRTITLIPWALPTAVMGVAWAWIFNDQYGVVNDILRRLGLIETGISWLGNPTLAMIAVILADVWKTTPFIALLLLAGLQSIPGDLYEAHSLDGATPWQSFWKITVPLLMPQIIVSLLFRFAQAFAIFDLIQVMTGGGPGGATETVSIYIYSTVMRYLDFGYGSALIVVTFLILVIAVAIASLLLTRARANAAGVR